MWKYPSDIRVSKNSIDPKSSMVRYTGPRQLFLFLDSLGFIISFLNAAIFLDNQILRVCFLDIRKGGNRYNSIRKIVI